MVEHLLGPLYYERIGRNGSPMVFVHANPMDQSSWMYQMAHLSTWYRCLAIDLPGYGRSPKAAHGLTLSDLAQACWEAADDAGFDGPAVLVGCSAGSLIIAQMHHLRPSRTAALVMSGTGDWPEPEWGELLAARIKGYVEQGVAFRYTYTLAGFSPEFRTTPLARFFAELFTERNDLADVASIIYELQALAALRPPDFYSGISCPTLILSGSEDNSYQRAPGLSEAIPHSELRVLKDAGHACHLEQPWLFDRYMTEFLDKHGLLKRAASPSAAPRTDPLRSSRND